MLCVDLVPHILLASLALVLMESGISFKDLLVLPTVLMELMEEHLTTLVKPVPMAAQHVQDLLRQNAQLVSNTQELSII